MLVRVSYSRRGGRYVEGPTKGKRRKKVPSILLPRKAVKSLQEHKEKQEALRASIGDAYQDNNLVFANKEGGYIHPNTFTNRFKRLIAKAGLPEVRVHEMRHSNATAMIAKGTHPKVVQERLRHATMRTTERYLHVNLEMQEGAADALDTLVDDDDEAV